MIYYTLGAPAKRVRFSAEGVRDSAELIRILLNEFDVPPI